MLDNQAIEPSSIFYPEADSEPTKPTDEVDSVEAGEDETIEESEVEAELVDDAETDDSEADAEEEAQEEDDDESEDQDALYLELDGEEHNLDDIREALKSRDSYKSMQADYTKKSMANADERKALEADREALTAQQTKAGDLLLELEALVAEDEDIDWAELKDIDPDEYIKLKEKADKRATTVAKLKSEQPKGPVALTQEELRAESSELFSSNPTWVKDGKVTKAYDADIELVRKFAEGLGFSQDEMKNMYHAHHWKALLIGARAQARVGKKKSILDKKVRKAPVVTKPKKKAVKSGKSAENLFYGEA